MGRLTDQIRVHGHWLWLLLPLTVLALWVRSHYVDDVMMLFGHRGSMQFIQPLEGSTHLVLSSVETKQRPWTVRHLSESLSESGSGGGLFCFGTGGRTLLAESIAHESKEVHYTMLGFHLMRSPTYRTVGGSVAMLTVPYWFWLLVAAGVAGRKITSHHMQQLRSRRGLCVSCGYDLRCTPQRCPECGATASAPAELAQAV